MDELCVAIGRIYRVHNRYSVWSILCRGT